MVRKQISRITGLPWFTYGTSCSNVVGKSLPPSCLKPASRGAASRSRRSRDTALKRGCTPSVRWFRPEAAGEPTKGPCLTGKVEDFLDPKIYWIPRLKTYWFPNNLRKSPSGIRNSQLLGHGAFVLLPTTHSLPPSTVHVQWFSICFSDVPSRPLRFADCLHDHRPTIRTIHDHSALISSQRAVRCDVMSLSGRPACRRLANMRSRTKDFRTTVTSEMDMEMDMLEQQFILIVSQLNHESNMCALNFH